MNIALVVNPRVTGVEYHRLLVPYQHLASNYSDVNVFQLETVGGLNVSDIKNFDVVVFSRLISASGNTPEIVSVIKKAGVKILLDIDDYWHLPESHLMYKKYIDHKIPYQTMQAIRGADLITTTTPYFAKEITPYNVMVSVLPNAIDPSHEQFNIIPQAHDRLKFGWIGGVHHREDIDLLANSIGRVHSDETIKGKYKLVLGGWTDNYIYNEFCKVFSDNYKADKESFSPIKSEDAFNYATMYNNIHVALAPLKENKFNNCKSQLKVIEAAFMKKAIIVSNTSPYTIDCNVSNSILVNESDWRNGWYRAIKRMINNPSLVYDLAAKLHEDITIKYHISSVNQKRYEVLKSLKNE